MITMLSPEYVKKAAERTERIKGDISFARFMGITEDQIKESTINYGPILFSVGKRVSLVPF